MAPQSRILTTLARTRLQSGKIGGRSYYTATGSRRASPTWDSPARRVTGTMMMFIPVAAATLFWPVICWPIMDAYNERS